MLYLDYQLPSWSAIDKPSLERMLNIPQAANHDVRIEVMVTSRTGELSAWTIREDTEYRGLTQRGKDPVVEGELGLDSQQSWSMGYFARIQQACQ